MNKISTLILLCFFNGFLFSQSVQLKWEGSKVIDFGTDKIVVPLFTNEGFSFEGQNVYYSVNQNADEQKKATNLKWEKVSQKEIFDLNPNSLPSTDENFSQKYYNKYEKNTVGFTRVSALKVEKGQIYRLASFDLVKDQPTAKRVAAPQNFTANNPLKTGNFYKIKVDKSGVFKITTKFLRDNGINPSNVNPQNLRIYGNGGVMLPEYNSDFRYPALQENAIEVVGEADGKWDDADYAIFYAQGPNGFNLYPDYYGSGNKRTETRTDRSSNVVNIYDDYSYYFISFDNGPGKRIQKADTPLTATEEINRYDAYQYINEEKFNLMKFGRVWTGDAFTGDKTVTFTTSSPIQSSDIIQYRARVVGYNSQKNKVTYTINDKNPQTLINTDIVYAPLSYLGNLSNITGNQISLKISSDITTNPNGRFYFDYAEVIYKEDLKFNGQQLAFRDYENVVEGSGQPYTFSLNNTTGLEQIWDVSDITNVTRKVNKSASSSEFKFGYLANSATFNNEFVAFNNTASYTPTFAGKVENQDLSSLQGIEYLMISSPEQLPQAQRLANFYQNKYKGAVVDATKIYNEFSSGRKDITAIRDFATKLNTPAGTLKYIFILGDASYDYRGKAVPGSDIVPSYQSEESGKLEISYVTDDYYGMTAGQPAGVSFANLVNYLPDIPVGRLPSANLTEAKLLIDKTLAYNNALPGQSTPFGEWRMKLDFVVDDDDDNEGSSGGTPFHTTVNKALVNNFETGTTRNEYNVRKLYLDAFTPEIAAGGQRYPQVNQAIANDVGNSLYLFYFGHGGINGWAQERVLTIDEIKNFGNYNNIFSRFPLVSTITCEFTLWDDPGTASAGEQTIKNPQGGAATMITSSRPISVDYGVRFTDIFTNHIFELNNDQFLTLGDDFLKAKIAYRPNSNHLRVNFLGDPAGKLSRPQRLLTIDAIESPIPNQIRALDFVKIKGHVNKADGSLDTSFNGRVVINIFDKKLTKKTLNNDNNPDFNPPLVYQEEGSPIVKTSATVVNGNYTAEFYVPKDINYNLGTGRILAYADNKTFDVFTNQTQQIGGINPDGINDTKPPVVHLYMNNTNFANGGITNQNPMLLACVTDDKGLNSTGSGVGHDITTYLDGQIINTIVLNDFYFPGEGNGCINPSLADYQKGVVTYPFRNLTPGEHQLTFKIWDINNNSTTETLNFIVKDESDQKLVVKRLLNWPNPFTDKTYVQFEHNCDDILDVNVQIYTITGKLVRTLSSIVTAEPFLEGYRTPRTAIGWDGKDDFGDAVGKGTYIFKIFAKSQNQDKCKGSATAVEKMVLLK